MTLAATRADRVVFLGLDADGHGVFATDLSGMEGEQAAELAGADRAVDVRMIVGTLSLAEAATAGYGRGLLHWHRNQRFCGSCGAATESAWGGHQRAAIRIRICLRRQKSSAASRARFRAVLWTNAILLH